MTSYALSAASMPPHSFCISCMEIKGDVGRYREIQGDTGRYREIQGDTGRYREI